MENAGLPVILQPETDFAEFYYGIISKLFDLKCRQISVDVKTALRNMRAMKREGDTIQQNFFSYKIPAVRCAYMYAFSVLHSVILYSEFSNYLEKKFMPTLVRESLKICCIGGGPGTEAVAICKSINDFVRKSNPSSGESLQEIEVTVVDKLPHWKREETAVVNAVNDKSNILHSERVVLHSDFMKADILKPFEKNLEEKIKEADIVTIIKIGSHIQEKKSDDCQEELQNMLRNVIRCMDDNSCLFMLDSAGGNVFYNMRKVFRESIGTSVLKFSDHKEYTLDQKTLIKLSDLLKYNHNSKYQPSTPTGKGKVSSCLWIKNRLLATKHTKDSSKEKYTSEISSENPGYCDLRCEGNPIVNERNSDLEVKSDVTVSEKKQSEGKKKKNKKIKKKDEK